MDDTRDWQDTRREGPVNEMRVRTYGWIMDAEATLDALRRRRARRDGAVPTGLDFEQPDPPADEDLYLATVSRYVTALGGHLEVRAVFPDETITLLVDPPAAGPSSAPA